MEKTCKCDRPYFDEEDICLMCGQFRGYYLNAIFNGYEKQSKQNLLNKKKQQNND